MKRTIRRTVAALALAGACGGAAGAAALEFGVVYRAAGPGGGGLLSAGVSDLPFGRGTLAATLSTRGAEVRTVQGFALPPAGTLSGRAAAAVTWRGGVRLTAEAGAALGPVALNLSATGFTAPATDLDPLAAWTLAPTDLRPRGGNLGFSARYRVSRRLIALLDADLGPQNQLLVGAEWRRDLTRPLPPAEGDGPEAAPTSEQVGALALRLGARAGQGVLGLTGGLTYSGASGLTLALDGLVGPGQWGAVGRLGAPGLLGEGSEAQLYLAYEPWRQAAAPLRAGAEVALPAGPGTLRLEVRGGGLPGGAVGLGARVGYAVALGGTGRP